jgi:hypothetical protein
LHEAGALKVIAELGDRSTVQYPIPISKKLPLPPVHSDLVAQNGHQPSLGDRIKN